MDAPYSFANLMNGGDLISELPFPTLTVSGAHRSLLHEIAEKEDVLLNPEDPKLVETFVNMLEKTNVNYLYVKGFRVFFLVFKLTSFSFIQKKRRLKPEVVDLKKTDPPSSAFFKKVGDLLPNFITQTGTQTADKGCSVVFLFLINLVYPFFDSLFRQTRTGVYFIFSFVASRH